MKKSLHILAHLFGGTAIIFVFNAVFMLLWNALLPQIFGIAAINFWQSLGLLVLLAGLSKFMVISAFLGMRGYRHNPVREKWMKMTSEERREFIQNRHRHHHHYGFGHDFFSSEESGKTD
jgi:threonine/homoserine/homoserine lactone efflux protein